jgi:serine/threonine-protein kinase
VTERLTRWEQIQALFAEARERPAAEWDDLLAAATADASVRAEVRSLLAADAGGALDRVVGFVQEARARPSPAPPVDPLPRLRQALAGRYRLERELGRGGMAIVYLAHDVKHGRRVALKVLRPELAAHVGPRRFLREIDTAARLMHPHILPLHDSGDADGLSYFVMPYVEGESLRDRLNREGQIPIADVLTIARQVSDALSHAHSVGIIHRDVKPENILFAGTHALVADFGIARALDAAGSDRITETGMAVGTPAYMSPEQANAGRVIDARSDIYSLGCVVYEMLGGQPPFTGPTPQAILARHTLDPVPSLRTLRPGLPAALQEVIERALAKVPADRFTTAREFADALEGAGRDAPRPRRAVLFARAATIGLVALVLGGGWLARHWLFGRGSSTAAVVVLPTADLSGGTDGPGFATGVHEGLIAELARIRGLRVIAGPSARRYADSRKTVPEIARELDVRWVIEPSVRRTAESLRVHVQLIQAVPEERQRWGESFGAPTTAVLGLYRDVAQAIAGELHVDGSAGEPASRASRRMMNPQAYEAYLRGMSDLEHRTPEALATGVASLHAAVALDPADPQAYAGLAYGYALIGHTPNAPVDAFARARAAAGRAILLDSTVALGHAALAMVKLYARPEWDWDGAGRAFERALELNPSLADTRVHYAWYLMLVGRADEAVAQTEWARRIDPWSRSNAARIARLYWMDGRHQAALEALADSSLGHDIRALVYESQRRFPHAVAAAERAAAESASQRWVLAHVLAVAGRRDDARRLVREIEREPRGPNAWGLAQAYVALGDTSAALQALDVALEGGHPLAPWIPLNPNFAPLRGDPRFEALRRRLSLPP